MDGRKPLSRISRTSASDRPSRPSSWRGSARIAALMDRCSGSVSRALMDHVARQRFVHTDLAKSARLSADNKVKKAREKIECYMDNNDIEVLTLDGLEIKRKVTQAVRKESIEIPNEYYDKVTFSIKEK